MLQIQFFTKGTPTYELAEDRKEEDRNDDQQQKESDYHRLKQVEQPNQIKLVG